MTQQSFNQTLATLSGKVVSGIDLGARFGVATANIDTDFDTISIPEGVYFVEVTILNPLNVLHKSSTSVKKNSSLPINDYDFSIKNNNTPNKHKAIMHYGPRKTFGGEKSIEIHLLDFSGNLYEKELFVTVKKFHRFVQKFPNADLLFTQIETDITQAQKYFLRKSIQNHWQKISLEQKVDWSQKTCQKLTQFPPFLDAQNVLAFVPMSDEIPFIKTLIELFPLKKYFFSRIENNPKNMQFFTSTWKTLINGTYTLEPPQTGTIFDFNTPENTLIFVPALAVSLTGKRLGRGGGFYDQFLANCVPNQKISTVSVQPDFAVLEKIPTEPHDQKVEQVLVIK